MFVVGMYVKHIILEGPGGMLPRKNFVKMVQFRGLRELFNKGIVYNMVAPPSDPAILSKLNFELMPCSRYIYTCISVNQILGGSAPLL